jgi:hypothetical protein
VGYSTPNLTDSTGCSTGLDALLVLATVQYTVKYAANQALFGRLRYTKMSRPSIYRGADSTVINLFQNETYLKHISLTQPLERDQDGRVPIYPARLSPLRQSLLAGFFPLPDLHGIITIER